MSLLTPVTHIHDRIELAPPPRRVTVGVLHVCLYLLVCVVVVDKETVMLLETVKTIVTKESGEKKGKQVKKGNDCVCLPFDHTFTLLTIDVTKLAVKIVLLYEDKKLHEDSFEPLAFNFRRICSTIKNNYRNHTFNKDTGTLQNVCCAVCKCCVDAQEEMSSIRTIFNQDSLILLFIFLCSHSCTTAREAIPSRIG